MTERAGMTYEKARELFRYDPISGKLYWKVRSAHCVKIGDEVGAVVRYGARRYRQCNVGNRRLLVHRIIWLLIYGRWPENDIDHEDHDGLNNRRVNLRDVERPIGNRNLSLRSDNTSGYPGVHWCNTKSRWTARAKIGGKITHLGLFVKKKAAIEASKLSHEQLGFHPNHGKQRKLA